MKSWLIQLSIRIYWILQPIILADKEKERQIEIAKRLEGLGKPPRQTKSWYEAKEEVEKQQALHRQIEASYKPIVNQNEQKETSRDRAIKKFMQPDGYSFSDVLKRCRAEFVKIGIDNVSLKTQPNDFMKRSN